MDEQKAVEYLDGLKKRAFMTMNEVDLANLVIKYKNELSKEIDKNRKAIEYINKEEKIYEINKSSTQLGCIDFIVNTNDFKNRIIDILRGNDE